MFTFQLNVLKIVRVFHFFYPSLLNLEKLNIDQEHHQHNFRTVDFIWALILKRIMFARVTGRSIRRIRGTRGVSTSSSILKRFDKSILYPTLLVVLLGSQIMNVMDAQKSVEDLERRYKLKMDKIDELKTRFVNGEQVDVDKEMALVNKLFQRKNPKDYLKSTSDKFGNQFGGLKKNELGLDDQFSEDALNKFLGLDPTPVEVSKSQFNEPQPIEKLSHEDIDFQVKNEKELLNYKLDPHKHVVVENPGDYVDAAKDTKITRFL